jgi:hypothetical protein
MFNPIKSLHLIPLLLLVIGTACGDSSEQPEAVATEAMPEVEVIPSPTMSPTLTPMIEASSSNPSSSSDSLQPDDGPMLTFNISGGLIGFCDELSIAESGAYILRLLCDQKEISGMLEPGDLATLQTWGENLADFQLTFQDNPRGPDNLVTNLIFKGQGEIEADEQQRQIIFDWASGLVARLRPQQAEPTPTPGVAIEPSAALCPEIGRPALVTVNVNSPDLLLLVDPDSQASCEFGLSQLPFGRIATAAGNIYYPVFDAQAKFVSILELKASGEQIPLVFTRIAMQQPGPFDFVVSGDGSKIAWAWTEIERESEPPIYRNSLWLADLDGANQIALLDRVENNEIRFVTPIRFSAKGDSLYYALQPDIGGPAFSGRYDNLYSTPVTGGPAQLHYACPSAENPICITGFAPDDSVLTVIQPAENALQIIAKDDGLINMIPLPATDYVERSVFGPNGNLAFVSATLAERGENEPPVPDPGYISFLEPPYTGQAQILLSDNRVGTIWGWLDETQLAFGALDQEGNTNSSLIATDGQVIELSPNITVAILR